MIVLAGGMGARMGADRNKVYLRVAGREVLAYALATMATVGIDRLVVVARRDEHDHVAALLAEWAPTLTTTVVPGGDTRHRSEFAGLAALADEIDGGAVDVVGVHDAARPFADRALINRLLAATESLDGAIPVVPFDDTVFRPADGVFVDTAPLVRVQTPQVFRADLVLDAHRKAADAGFDGVDTAQVVELFRADTRIGAVPGSPANFKVTYADDIARAENHLAGARLIEDRPDIEVRVRDVRSLSEDVVGFDLDGHEPAAGLPDGVDARFRLAPATDAVKFVDDGLIVETVDRAALRLVRPPEVVRRSALVRAVAALDDEVMVNPSRVVAEAGGTVEAIDLD
jgi:2-C-methyl-D-erythritol 4-phosphate cytidylyltransferase